MKVPLSERMTPELVFAQCGGMNRNVMWDVILNIGAFNG